MASLKQVSLQLKRLLAHGQVFHGSRRTHREVCCILQLSTLTQMIGGDIQASDSFESRQIRFSAKRRSTDYTEEKD